MPAPKGHAPYPGCETGGRPKKFTVAYIEKAAEELEKWVKSGNFIWFEEFCEEKDYFPEHMTAWADSNEKFNKAYQKAKLKQKNMLIKGGLNKDYQYNMVALLLSHGWNMVEQSKQTISGDPDNPLAPWIVQANGKSKDLVDE